MVGPVLNGMVGSYATSPNVNPDNSRSSTTSAPSLPKMSGTDHYSKSARVAEATKETGKGIFNEAINTVKSLFTWKGLAMSAGMLGSMLLFPTLLPFIALAGVGVGTVQVGKGIKEHDWGRVGAGLFMVGSSFVGMKYGPKSSESLDLDEETLNTSFEQMNESHRRKADFSSQNTKRYDTVRDDVVNDDMFSDGGYESAGDYDDGDGFW